VKLSREELYKKASETIRVAREETESLMKEGFIPLPQEK
ncbi:unnamed protein product, partial [marine sediment metagenome]